VKRFFVKKLLLVGTSYDAYILEEINLRRETPFSVLEDTSLPPIYEFVNRGQKALKILKQKDFDLVLADLRSEDMDAFELAKRMRQEEIKVPVILLTSDRNYARPLSLIPEQDQLLKFFTWYGNPELIQVIVAFFEDFINAAFLLSQGKTRSIILVEDEPGLYSHYLPLIYNEIFLKIKEFQLKTSSIFERIRFEKRPLVLLAHDFKEAKRLIDSYHKSIIGVITDLQFPLEKEIDPEAGLKLTRYIKEKRRQIPVILQSKIEEIEEKAHEADAFFLWKSDEHLLSLLHYFIRDYFGFGDFIFRLSDGIELARAKSFEDFFKISKTVPPESLSYHLENAQFSVWFYIRGQYTIAERLQSLEEKEIKDPEEIRKEILNLALF
jgi:CheY-like chemotaxis protein